MDQTFVVKLSDGTIREVHQSAVASAATDAGGESAHDVIRSLYDRIAGHDDQEPLLLKTDGGSWTVAKLNPAHVVGIFMIDHSVQD